MAACPPSARCHCQDVHCLDHGDHDDHNIDHDDDGDHDARDGDNIVRRLPSTFNFVEECILGDGQSFKKIFLLFEIVQKSLDSKSVIMA